MSRFRAFNWRGIIVSYRGVSRVDKVSLVDVIARIVAGESYELYIELCKDTHDRSSSINDV